MVERDAAPQRFPLPADAGVEDRDLHARVACRALPCAVGADARDLAERVAPGGEVLRLLPRGVLRVLVRGGELRTEGGEPEALVLLAEDAVALGAAVVVGLARIEVRVVRGVRPDGLVRVGAGEARR